MKTNDKNDKTIENDTIEIYDEFEISKLLIELGVHSDCNGYDYIIIAMNLIKKNRNALNNITKQIYPEIARIKNVMPANVERCIRTEMCRVINYKNNELRQQIFGNDYKTMTNSRFLSGIYEYFRINKRIPIATTIH